MSQVKPEPIFHQSFPAVMEAWPAMRSGVLEAARLAAWGDDDLGRLELLFEEGALNIINHAYAGEEGEIEIALFPVDEGVLLRLSDSGPPFDPVSAQTPDLDAPTEERSIGGLGIHLMKTLAERLEYRRENGRNVLEIVLKQQGG